LGRNRIWAFWVWAGYLDVWGSLDVLGFGPPLLACGLVPGG